MSNQEIRGLGCTSSCNGLGDLGDLVASADDLLALTILVELDIFVLSLSALPDLDFASAADNAYSHCGEKVMSSVRVHVDTSVEHLSSVFADAGGNHGTTSRMLLNESGNVVDNACYGDEASAVLGLILEVVPFHDRQGLERNTPVQLRALLIELLLHLLNTPLFDFVLLELLKVVCKTELLPHPDRPLGGVVLPEINGIAVIAWKFMVEVVVALTEGNKSCEYMVAWRVSVVERLVTQPVCK